MTTMRSRVGRLARPFLRYFDNRFAELRIEIDELKAQLDTLQRKIEVDADAVNEISLGAERSYAAILERLDALAPDATAASPTTSGAKAASGALDR